MKQTGNLFVVALLILGVAVYIATKVTPPKEESES